MTAVLVRDADSANHREAVYITSVLDRLSPPPPSGERRHCQDAALSLAGLADRLRREDVLHSNTCQGLQRIGQLMSYAHNNPHIVVDKIVALLDRSLYEHSAAYAKSPPSLARHKTEILDFVTSLTDAGLLSTDTATFQRLVAKSDEPALKAIRDAALFEAAKALQSQASTYGAPASPALDNACNRAFSEFFANGLALVQNFFEFRRDGRDLVVSTRVHQTGSNGGEASFRLKDFDERSEAGGVFLYKLSQLYVNEPQSQTIVDTHWFQELARYGELESLSNCNLNSQSLIAHNRTSGMHLKNVHFTDTTLSLSGRINLDGVTFSDCRVLFKDCQHSHFIAVTTDRDCTLGGNISSSKIDKDCSFRGHAGTLKMQQCTWETASNQNANGRMSGLIFHTSLVDERFLTAIGKYKFLSPQEVLDVNIKSNEHFDNDKAKKSLNQLGFEVKTAAARPSPGFVPPAGATLKDLTVTEIIPAPGSKASSTLTMITPKVTPQIPGQPRVNNLYFEAELYNKPIEELQRSATALAPYGRYGNISLLLLGILGIQAGPRSYRDLPKPDYRLRDPKDISWPPAPPQPPPEIRPVQPPADRQQKETRDEPPSPASQQPQKLTDAETRERRKTPGEQAPGARKRTDIPAPRVLPGKMHDITDEDTTVPGQSLASKPDVKERPKSPQPRRTRTAFSSPPAGLAAVEDEGEELFPEHLPGGLASVEQQDAAQDCHSDKPGPQFGPPPKGTVARLGNL